MGFDIREMQYLQQVLQNRYAGWWEPVDPPHGRNKMLWMMAEMGEVIQLIKKQGDQAVMTDEAVRHDFVEEMCDVLMYFNDICLCYGVSPEELEAIYRAKHERNLTRWKIPQK